MRSSKTDEAEHRTLELHWNSFNFYHLVYACLRLPRWLSSPCLLTALTTLWRKRPSVKGDELQQCRINHLDVAMPPYLLMFRHLIWHLILHCIWHSAHVWQAQESLRAYDGVRVPWAPQKLLVVSQRCSAGAEAQRRRQKRRGGAKTGADWRFQETFLANENNQK